MHCPKCGAEVSEQSVYCHRCGERIDLMGEEPSPEVPTASPPASEDGPPQSVADQATARSSLTSTDMFREGLAARTPAEDEPEEELWQGHFSSKAMLGTWALSGLLTVAVLAVWIMWIKSQWIVMLVVAALPWLYTVVVLKYRQWGVRYQFTNQRFIHETGILRRVTDRIEIIDMDDITFEQKLLERFVGVGTIRISSSDRTHPELLLRGIEDVKRVAGLIDDTRRSERRRRGLHIESI
jgi:membrane protein YdbS with pleckstrin-like domain